MPILRQIAQLGHPVLRTIAAPVDFPASAAVLALIDDMLATLRQADGVGIAAPQVYEPQSIFILASRPNPRYPDAPLMEPEVVINPEIVERSAEMVKGWEGCLSIPGIRGEVPRHRRIRARYQTLDGREVENEFTDFVARIFQHEDDHLRGIVFLDRLESTRDLIMEKEYQKRFGARGRSSESRGAASEPGRLRCREIGIGTPIATWFNDRHPKGRHARAIEAAFPSHRADGAAWRHHRSLKDMEILILASVKRAAGRSKLPDYARMMSAYHRAFARELQEIVRQLTGPQGRPCG